MLCICRNIYIVYIHMYIHVARYKYFRVELVNYLTIRRKSKISFKISPSSFSILYILSRLDYFQSNYNYWRILISNNQMYWVSIHSSTIKKKGKRKEEFEIWNYLLYKYYITSTNFSNKDRTFLFFLLLYHHLLISILSLLILLLILW